MSRSVLGALSLACLCAQLAGTAQEGGAEEHAEHALLETLAAGGVDLDQDAQAVSIEAAVLIKSDLLEYLLVIHVERRVPIRKVGRKQVHMETHGSFLR